MIVNVCDTSILCRDGKSHKEFRKEITIWLRNNHLDKSYTNSETGIEILVNRTCIEKITSSFGDIKAHAFTSMQSIIETANFIASDDDNKDRPDFIKILKFETLIDVNNDKYGLWIYVRQTQTQNFLYSLNVAAQKML